MKNKMRRLSRSSDKEAILPSSKSKEKSKNKKSQLPYASHHQKNSLGMDSPRQSKPIEKYRTYIQFVATNKLSTDHGIQIDQKSLMKKTHHASPRRNSPVPYIKGRKSAMAKFHQPPSPSHLNLTQRNSFPKQKGTQENKTTHGPFYVHGKNPRSAKNSQQIKQRRSFGKQSSNTFLKNQQEKKKNPSKQIKEKKKSNRQKSTNKSSIESNFLSTKLEKQEEKLCQKLFKGIQFYRDLGRGAHALVRSAVDWNHKRKIAVKIYEKSELTEQELSSIERQIQILNDLEHENIVTLYEIIETYKTINLVMEYGGGNSLDQYMKSKPEGHLNQAEAKSIFKQILEAVDYLHAKNITHRDIKTENILLNKHLHLKIIDFGFSLICKNGAKTIINSYCGTPTYMGPEVVSKTPHNPQLADRWSLGILLFNILNGHCPFRASTQKQLFAKIHLGEYEFSSDVKPSAKDLIYKFLKKLPSQRLSPKEALDHPWFKE